MRWHLGKNKFQTLEHWFKHDIVWHCHRETVSNSEVAAHAKAVAAKCYKQHHVAHKKRFFPSLQVLSCWQISPIGKHPCLLEISDSVRLRISCCVLLSFLKSSSATQKLSMWPWHRAPDTCKVGLNKRWKSLDVDPEIRVATRGILNFDWSMPSILQQHKLVPTLCMAILSFWKLFTLKIVWCWKGIPGDH